MKLSDKSCKLAQAKDKPYKLFDGAGVYLLVNPNGSKLWQMKYRYLGKEKLIALGAYPIVTLKQVREERDNAKKLLAQNPPIDPVTNRKQTRQEAVRNNDNTFKAVALEWYEVNEPNWSEKHARKIKQRMKNNIFPYIGDRPIKDITPPELLETLRKMESKGAYDIAKRMKQLSGRVFQYGIQVGKCEWNAAQNLTGALKTKPVTHHRTIDIKELPDFIKALEGNKARLFEQTRRAIWLSLYTFCRPQEIRMAKWAHIDFEERLWTIPAEMMKMRKDHIVPLSTQVIEILKSQRAEHEMIDTEWVFPSRNGFRKPISDGTVNKAIQKLGFGEKMVAHGFRALARTAISEKLRYPSEVIEKQLAHKTSNPLGEAYDRAQFVDERVKMMQDWADYINKTKVERNEC